MGKYLEGYLFHGGLGDLDRLHLLLPLEILDSLVLDGPVHDRGAAVAVGLAVGLGEEVVTHGLLLGHVLDDVVQHGEEEVPVGLGPAFPLVPLVPGKEKMKTKQEIKLENREYKRQTIYPVVRVGSRWSIPARTGGPGGE